MYRPITAARTSLPLWMIALVVFGVLAILGIAIGLLIHFLAVGNKTYYYRGSFKVLNIPYNRNYEKHTSEETNYLSKFIETKMSDTFENSDIFKQYISSQVTTLVPYDNSIRANIWLVFKSMKGNAKEIIQSILYQMLKNNCAPMTADPDSLQLTEISRIDAEKMINSLCGRRARMSTTDDRIRGGSSAQKGEWPWQASIRFNGHHQCGASLISERHLVTAAHCFKRMLDPKNYTVSFGTALNPPYMKRNIQQLIIHEKYDPKERHDDIAIVVLTEKVAFESDVHTVCLPEASQVFAPGEGVVVTGWGRLAYDDIYPNILHKAPIKLIDTKTCNSKDSYNGMINDTMLCAGYMEGNIDACKGDSGGPLVYPNSRSIWYLVGVVSWGTACGMAKRPGVYTRVTSYRDWIANKTGI